VGRFRYYSRRAPPLLVSIIGGLGTGLKAIFTLVNIANGSKRVQTAGAGFGARIDSRGILGAANGYPGA
jgi:hypothetical protein